MNRNRGSNKTALDINKVIERGEVMGKGVMGRERER